MNHHLLRWIADADALRHIEQLRVPQSTLEDLEVNSRADDYYLSLAGELFGRMRESADDPDGWAKLGNALALIAAPGQETELKRVGISQSEANLFAAAAFYCGGFPASAYVTIRRQHGDMPGPQSYLACTDLLGRPTAMRSQLGQSLLNAVAQGDLQHIENIRLQTEVDAADKLSDNPIDWIPARLLEKLVSRFSSTNLRAVLPQGELVFWTPFVQSLLMRRPAIWEFFPSQIDAIKRGLIDSEQTFSLQMPTSAGKTALAEAVLYWHAKTSISDVAIMLVPYRSLASELKGGLVKNLNGLGIPAKCIYGGTVPSGDEVHDLINTRVIVATPEALSGLLSAGDLIPRVTLVICDEGHLLDGDVRGVGLEMLLARLKSRPSGSPRFVFISAIVPNVDEINTWLGGDGSTVVKSSYRPAIAEYSVLRREGTGATSLVHLEMHPHLGKDSRYMMKRFLSKEDFTFRNPTTGRSNTYSFTSFSTLAIAAARKALEMGTVAVFAANKRGAQGAIGLAEELGIQLSQKLGLLPGPDQYADQAKLSPVIDYLTTEYGQSWIGTQTVKSGAVLHHGDIPQETREVLEGLLRQEAVRFVICTSTLAEGVNLPIRTLVLYSVQRNSGQQPVPLLARDIKNLVGRAGRAGSTTKALVICVNEGQWHLVERVAREAPGEPVHGALLSLVRRLESLLALNGQPLTSPDLENTPELFALVDGIDSTLIDLAAEEIGEAALVAAAMQLVEQTFAAQRAEASTKAVLRSVFDLRARRIAALVGSGRLGWIRSAGARPRLVDNVEANLLPIALQWTSISDPVDANVVSALFNWAWEQPEFQDDVQTAYRPDPNVDIATFRGPLYAVVTAWLKGQRFVEIAASTGDSIDTLLGIHTSLIAFSLQTLVEQSVALLQKLLEERGIELSTAVLAFPEHLRFGVTTAVARTLRASGLRHRLAAVALGDALTSIGVDGDNRVATLAQARSSLQTYPEQWRTRLGQLVFENSVGDLGGANS
jgi:helicase